MNDQTSTPTPKNSPTGKQQDLPKVPVGIDHADDQPVSSEGNQSIKDAAEHIDPAALAEQLDTTSKPKADKADDVENTAPYAGYVTGKVPDTEK